MEFVGLRDNPNRHVSTGQWLKMGQVSSDGRLFSQTSFMITLSHGVRVLTLLCVAIFIAEITIVEKTKSL